MKILNIPKTNFNRVFKGNTIKFPNNKEKNSSSIPSFIDPKYYQAKNAIILPVNLILENGDKIDIKPHDAIKYLTGQNGRYDKKLAQEFCLIYSFSKAKMEKKYEWQSRFYENIIKENENATEFETPKSMLSNILQKQYEELKDEYEGYCDPDFEFSKRFLSSITGSSKKDLAKTMLEETKEKRKGISQKAYERTLRIFQLSRTSKNSGEYDFSSLEEKYHLADIIDNIGYQYREFTDIEELYDNIALASKNFDGSLNIELAKEGIKNIHILDLNYEIEYVIELIKEYILKDPEHKDEILKMIQELNKGCYPMIPGENYFQTMMDLCFENNKIFSPQRASDTLEAIDAVSNFLDLKIDEGDMSKDFFDKYERYLIIGEGLIKSYFKNAQDENGAFTTPEISFGEFLNEQSKKLLIF